jgi:hypothetical protein
MAEQEVVKHTKKIYKVWGSKEHSFWHKLKEFLIEIFIIVFAITLSIWFHNRSGHSHKQAEVKAFLLGLKGDLENDIKEMEQDKKSYARQHTAFSYITSIKYGELLNKDSLRVHFPSITNTTSINTNDGRFQGFKSSGKIGDIENAELQNDIMDLYTEDFTTLQMSTSGYIGNKRKLADYLIKNNKRLSDSTSNGALILSQDEAQNICNVLSYTGEITGRYDKCISKAKKIIEQINREYDLPALQSGR